MRAGGPYERSQKAADYVLAHQGAPVLSHINQILSDNHINIAAQYLQTKGSVGYVVIDLDAASSPLALDKLAQVPGTIRSRVLF